jgi:Zn-finger nucleic acid-binding protein
LESVERLGVALDHCIGCGGLWLDAGELETLVKREAVATIEEGHRSLTARRGRRPYDARETEVPARSFVDAIPVYSLKELGR